METRPFLIKYCFCKNNKRMIIMVCVPKQEYFEKNKDKINESRRRKCAENKEQINQKKKNTEKLRKPKISQFEKKFP